jgi:hypothetical protein
MAADDDESNPLTPYLSKRLPELGLDADTYCPYLLPLVDNDDQEEWESVLELLQASSETHQEETDCWSDLRTELENIWKDHLEQKDQQGKILLEEQAMEQQVHLEKERQLALAAAEEQKHNEKAPSNNVDDAVKQAMIQRFAYEDDEEDEEEMGVETNRDTAAQASAAQTQDMRSQKVSTKKDEQAKTKEAKMDKVRSKEDRRKRAVKGERKR